MLPSLDCCLREKSFIILRNPANKSCATFTLCTLYWGSRVRVLYGKCTVAYNLQVNVWSDKNAHCGVVGGCNMQLVFLQSTCAFMKVDLSSCEPSIFTLEQKNSLNLALKHSLFYCDTLSSRLELHLLTF